MAPRIAIVYVRLNFNLYLYPSINYPTFTTAMAIR